MNIIYYKFFVIEVIHHSKTLSAPVSVIMTRMRQGTYLLAVFDGQNVFGFTQPNVGPPN